MVIQWSLSDVVYFSSCHLDLASFQLGAEPYSESDYISHTHIGSRQ